MTDREIYPNAPLRFVAFELRMPPVPELAGPTAAGVAFAQLREVLPIIGGPQVSIEIQSAGPLGATGPSGPSAASFSAGPLRLLDRRRVLSALISTTAVVVENSDYHRYEDFLAIVERTLRAVSETAQIAGMQRVGLRYIDEIRVPGVEKPSDWRGYIDPALLAPLDLDGGFEVSASSGLNEYRISPSQSTNLRFGAMEGQVVNQSGPLRLKSDESGPFFLIDLDSFWTAPEDEVPEFSVDKVLETCGALRRPIRALFEASITDKLRDEVLRRTG